MASLPYDIIFNILCRLPIKDLLRYRCVSKLWCFLIDGPDFMNMHLKHSMETDSDPGLILMNYVHDQVFRFDVDAFDSSVKLYSPVDRNIGFNVEGSCNGLILLVSFDDHMNLWNPTTRRYRRLPTPGLGFLTKCDKPIIYGFGHDPINNDYKVVRAMNFSYPESNKVEIYSAKSNTWKSVSHFPCDSCPIHGPGVLASNALHWVANKNLVAFDLVTEEYREVSLPDYKDASFCINLGALDGSLYVAISFVQNEIYEESLSGSVDIWVLKDYGVKESWTKLFTLKSSSEFGFYSDVSLIALLKTGNQVLMILGNEKIILYDFKRELTRKTRIFGDLEPVEMISCADSLVRLDDNDWLLVEEDSKAEEIRSGVNFPTLSFSAVMIFRLKEST